MLLLQDGNLSISRYWDMPMPDESDKRSDNELCEELRFLLSRAVRRRMVSDVPLGVFLSGGIESSIVAGLMARQSSTAIKTFSIGFSEASSSSASKGESVADTIRTVSCYSDIIAMRHPKEGAPLVASMHSPVPIINAGDGGHNHPTQTLTDLLTIHREKGHFDGLTVGLCGDLKFGRTVHSLVAAMSRYPDVRFVLSSPEEFKLPRYVKEQYIKNPGIPYIQSASLEEVMPQLDILYMTRVQRERFFNEEDYLRLKDSYILTPEKLRGAKEDLRILHPLPRVNEISVAVYL